MASSALEALVSGAVLNVTSCAGLAAALQAVDCSRPLSSATLNVIALCLWDGVRTQHCTMPASRCHRPICLKPFIQLSLEVAASTFGVLCQQRQRLRDGIAAARGLLCQQPAVGSARRISLEHEHALCVDSPRLSTFYSSSVYNFGKEYTHYRSQLRPDPYSVPTVGFLTRCMRCQTLLMQSLSICSLQNEG